MNWVKDQWNKLPESLRKWLPRFAVWAIMSVAGYLVALVTGTKPEPVPFPVYVNVDTPTPVAEPLVVGCIGELPADHVGPVYFTGWVNDPETVAAIAAKQPFCVFADTPAGQADDPLPKFVYLWQCYEQIFARPPPSKNQLQVGSCVSFGTVNAIERTMAFEIAVLKQNKTFKHLAEEIVYGGSRYEIGKEKYGSNLYRQGDGSMGAWAAEFVKEGSYGVISREKQLDGKYDLSTYSESRARDYGRNGVPADLEPLAKERPVKDVTQVKSWSEAKKALAQGHAIAVCSNVGFTMQRDAKGVARASGSWAHCMCLDGYHVADDGKEYGHIENSWGADAHKGPVGWGNPPPSGFWAESATIDRMLKQDDSWCFASVKGFPSRKVIWPAALPDREHFARAELEIGSCWMISKKHPLAVAREFALAP